MKIQKKNINLFPNPATNTFEIKNNEVLESVSIYDNLGRQVKEFLKPETSYDITDLNSGIYFVGIKNTNSGVIEKKLIKE